MGFGDFFTLRGGVCWVRGRGNTFLFLHNTHRHTHKHTFDNPLFDLIFSGHNAKRLTETTIKRLERGGKAERGREWDTTRAPLPLHLHERVSERERVEWGGGRISVRCARRTQSEKHTFRRRSPSRFVYLLNKTRVKFFTESVSLLCFLDSYCL